MWLTRTHASCSHWLQPHSEELVISCARLLCTLTAHRHRRTKSRHTAIPLYNDGQTKGFTEGSFGVDVPHSCGGKRVRLKEGLAIGHGLNGSQTRCVFALLMPFEQLQAHAAHDLDGVREPLQQVHEGDDLIALQHKVCR